MNVDGLKARTGMKFNMIAILLIIIFSVAITPVTFQNDTYYTIKIGEHIQSNGIDMVDPFSWHDLSYTYPHWLYDYATWLVYASYGFMGLYVLTCILAAILGTSVYLVNSKLNKNHVLSFLLTVAVMYGLKSYIAARAQLATFILFIWTLYCIEKILEKKNLKAAGAYAIGLIGISTLMVNLHVAVWPFFFILFLPYVAQSLICNLPKLAIRILNRAGARYPRLEELKLTLITRSQEPKRPYKITMQRSKNAKLLPIVMLVSAFTGLLTPIGDTPYTYLYKTMQGNTTQNINEHLPMVLSNNSEMMLILAIFLGILIFTKVRISLQDLLMFGGLCFLMFLSKRQATMFALMGSVILNRLLMELNIPWLKERFEKIRTKRAIPFIGKTVLAGAMLLFSASLARPNLDAGFVNERLYPVEASNYILENLDVENMRLYNEYNYGSYLLYREIPVFIDSRADLYAPEFNGKDDIFIDFIRTSNLNNGVFYEDTFDKYGITHIISYKNSKMNMLISRTMDDKYEKLYEDSHFVIYKYQ